MALVAGCGGKGKNPGPLPVLPAEAIVAKFTSPTATAATLATATSDSFATLGFTDAASPLYDRPTDPSIASSVASLQVGYNKDNTIGLPVSQIATAIGKDTPTAFATNLNAFVSANYNGSNKYLQSLARLIALSGGTPPATAPTITTSTVLQPYQAYYVTVWASTVYSAQTRGDFCLLATTLDYWIKVLDAFLAAYGNVMPAALKDELVTLRATMYDLWLNYKSQCHGQ